MSPHPFGSAGHSKVEGPLTGAAIYAARKTFAMLRCRISGRKVVMAKDHVRFAYAWMYGVQARKDGKARDVPQYWHEYADAWLKGFDGEPIADTPKSVSDHLEAELDEAAVSKPPPGVRLG
jgi:hypothetical protein